MNLFRLGVIGLMSCTVLALGVALGGREDAPIDRDRLARLFAQGNYKDAFAGYQALALRANTESKLVGSDLTKALACLSKLGRTDENDALREAAVTAHKANWRLLQAAAESYLDDPHEGFIVAGKFLRAPARRAGRYVRSYDRDRSRALQLLVEGLERARPDPDRAGAGRYLLALARVLMGDRWQRDSWRLESLTPLDALADYEANFDGYWRAHNTLAPVDPDGTPVYYRVPESFQKAASDGQRWRWALAQAVEADAALLNTTRVSLANFFDREFGSETILRGPHGRMSLGGPAAAGPYALETLKDDETIARLATGIKRFTLPDEFNPIKIYETIVRQPQTGEVEVSLGELAAQLRNVW
jgi:alpha-2-macroglobulin